MLLCVSSMLTAGAHSQAASPSEDLQTMLWEQMSNCWASVSVRAVKKCAPYDFPAEHYAIWQNITFNFQYKPKEALSVS